MLAVAVGEAIGQISVRTFDTPEVLVLLMLLTSNWAPGAAGREERAACPEAVSGTTARTWRPCCNKEATIRLPASLVASNTNIIPFSGVENGIVLVVEGEDGEENRRGTGMTRLFLRVGRASRVEFANLSTSNGSSIAERKT